MQLTFLGAARTVTGSRYLVEAEGRRLLVDCGLFQGHKELRLRNWAPFPVAPETIDAVVLTHAHLDHSGYLPLLARQGFGGPIYCTRPTRDLCALLLPDSGHIQEEDAQRANRHRYSKHDPALPLYTEKDARAVLEQLRVVPFGQDVSLGAGIHCRFERAGHILGAAWAMLTAERRTVLFSGDIGRPNDPVMKAPVPPAAADYLIVESTYGDRLHDPDDPLDQLERVVRRTVRRGGSVIIPAFAVGRAQSMLYYLHTLRESGRLPHVPVYLDSPMAIEATDILERYPNEHRLDRATCAAVTRSARYIRDADASRALDQGDGPKIIIAASGMATGGRVLHHLEHFAPDQRNTILFTGFQAGGTRGDRMLRGEEAVKIHGKMVPIRAEVASLDSLSAHADYEEILDWLGHLGKPPIATFVTHGEADAAESLARLISERLGWPCQVPEQLHAVAL